MYHRTETIRSFPADIADMNEMYELEKIFYQHEQDAITRLQNFAKTLKDEVNEIDAVIATAESPNYDQARVRTELADLLGDLVVYCASEALRWDIPLADVLQIIMDSNKSKLGADGLPVKDETGKFLKGPNYWRPEPKITRVLQAVETVGMDPDTASSI